MVGFLYRTYVKIKAIVEMTVRPGTGLILITPGK